MGFKVGEAPWEKKTNSFKVGEAPWEAKGKDAAVLNDYADKLNPVQEMPEWLNKSDRYLVQNFSNSPQESIQNLQGKYPDKEFSAGPNGRLLGRSKGEGSWRSVDPDTGIFSKDFVNDAVDNGYNILATIPHALGTAAGATMGAFGGPVSSLAGAAVGAGYADKASEYMRQKIGQMIGINKGIDQDKINVAENSGAGSTLLFGAGANAPGIAHYGYDLAKSMGRGTAAAASGIDSELLKHYGQNISKIDGITSETPLAKKISDRALEFGQQGLDDTGEALSSKMEELKSPINIAPAKDVYRSRIAEIEAQKATPHGITPAMKSEQDSLRARLQHYFGRETPLKPTDEQVLSDSEIKGMYSKLDSLVGNNSLYAPSTIDRSVGYSVLQPKPVPTTTNVFDKLADTERMNLRKTSRTVLENTMPDRNAQKVDQMFGNYFNTSQDGINEIANHANMLKSESDALAKAYESKNQAAIDQVLAQIKQRRGQVIADKTEHLMPDVVPPKFAWRELQSKLKDPSGFDKKITDEEAATAQRALGKINEGFTNVNEQDGAVAAYKDAYANAVDSNSILQSKFGGNAPDTVSRVQTTLNTVRGLDKNGRRALNEELKNMEGQGLGIADDVKDLQTYQAFNTPTEGRKVPLAALLASLGSLVGYKAGGGYAGAAAGGMAGATVGAKMADPRAIQAAIRGVGSLESGAKYLGTFGNNISTKVPFYIAPGMVSDAVAPSVWDRMNKKPVQGQ